MVFCARFANGCYRRRMRCVWVGLLVLVAGCEHEQELREKAVVIVPRETAPAPAPAVAPKIPAPVAAPVERLVAVHVKGATSKMSPTAALLADTQDFASGGVGISGAMGYGEQLTRKLATEPNAVRMFDLVAASPNRVARLYAYWALRSLDPARAKALREILVDDTTPIETFSGCMGGVEKTNSVMLGIDSYGDMPTRRIWPPVRGTCRDPIGPWCSIPVNQRPHLRAWLKDHPNHYQVTPTVAP